MSTPDISASLSAELNLLIQQANQFFDSYDEYYSQKSDPWEIMQPSETLFGSAQEARKSVTDFAIKVMVAVRNSVVMRDDEANVRKLLHSMAENFSAKAPSGFGSKSSGMEPSWFRRSDFNREAAELREKFDLLTPEPESMASMIVASQSGSIQKFRPNTAFIIMQINESIPKLEDIKNTIKTAFKEFGIDAVRADDIEHSGVITQRVLDEIATSEFLIADLTGERPSVYYEVGYAHAIGKRPIMYRERGAPLHFDLLVHNVPEYKNITDLGKMLRERLKAITGREPKG